MESFQIAIEPLRALLVQVGAYLPRFGVALAIALIGWLLAKALRFASVKALHALNFHVLTERAGVDEFLQQGGTRKDTADLVGLIVFWLVLLAALIVASNGLGLTQITDVLARVLLFLPRLLVGLLVAVFGLYFARFVGQSVAAWCRGEGIGDAELIGRVVRYAIVTFVVLIAIDHLDLGSGLVQQTFLILLAGVVFGLALAFGLGARERAAEMIERWFPRAEPPGPR